MRPSTQRWIEAGKTLALDVNAKVLCPECQRGYLKTKDFELGKTGEVERLMFCEVCGGRNYLLKPLGK